MSIDCIRLALRLERLWLRYAAKFGLCQLLGPKWGNLCRLKNHLDLPPWSWRCRPTPCGILEVAATSDTRCCFSHFCGRGCPLNQSPETRESDGLYPGCEHFPSAIHQRLMSNCSQQVADQYTHAYQQYYRRLKKCVPRGVIVAFTSFTEVPRQQVSHIKSQTNCRILCGSDGNSIVNDIHLIIDLNLKKTS